MLLLSGALVTQPLTKKLEPLTQTDKALEMHHPASGL
jgi:hypothetical protein